MASGFVGVLGQRGDDAAEVADRGGLGAIGIAGRDRVHEDGELAEAHLWAPRPQRQLELVAHQLGLQPVDETSSHGLSGDVADQLVQPLDEGRVLQEVAGLERAAQGGEVAAEAVGLGCGDPLGGLAGDQCLQRHSRLGDGHRLVGGDHADPRPAVRDPLDQPIGGQRVDGQPDVAATDAQHRHEIGLHEPGTGEKVAVGDRSPQRALSAEPSRSDHAPLLLHGLARRYRPVTGLSTISSTSPDAPGRASGPSPGAGATGFSSRRYRSPPTSRHAARHVSVTALPTQEPTAEPTPTTRGGPSSWPTLEPWTSRPTAAPAEAVPADIATTPLKAAEGTIPTISVKARADPIRTARGSPGSSTPHRVTASQTLPATISAHRGTPRCCRKAPSRLAGTLARETTVVTSPAAASDSPPSTSMVGSSPTTARYAPA